MPLVHFFETSFGRTYERDIVLVEASRRRRLRLGRGHRRREPFLQRGVDRIGVADPARLRRAARAREAAEGGGGCVSADEAHPRAQHGARRSEAAVWDLEARHAGVPLWKQIGGGARREIPCGVSIGIQDSVEQLLGEDRDRTGRRLSAHQDEDQARLGRGRGRGGPRALSRRSS